MNKHKTSKPKQVDFGKLEVKILAEITRIINEPGMTWKQRRFQLRCLLGNNDELIEQLVPRPPEGMDFWPSDY